VLNAPDGAAVIDITKGAKRAARAARGRWQAMNHHQPPGNDNDGRSTAEQFADEIETSFNSIDRTLTDPGTAAVYELTLRLVERTLQSAEVQDIISEQQRLKLAGLMEGMRSAPGLL
jgi:hypothetical protein